MLSRDEKIDIIYDFIVGNEDLKQKGLAQRMAELEEHQQNDKDQRNKIIGGLAVIGAIGSIFIHFILKIFHL